MTESINQRISEIMTAVFVENSLGYTGSVKYKDHMDWLYLPGDWLNPLITKFHELVFA